MKKLILTLAGIIALTFTHTNASAQNGKVALGVRATPDGGGFTAKFFTTPNWVIETQVNAGGLIRGNGQSLNAVALLEYHIYMPDPQWQIFFGAGMHAGVWDHNSRIYNSGDFYYNDRHSEGIFGLDGIGGVAYKFKRIPLSLSADMKPAINLVEDPRFFAHNMFGISARFHIN